MILFFYGPNTFASRRKLQQMVAAYIKKTGSDYGLERIEGPSAKLKDLMGALAAVPFLASSRLVIIEDLSKNKTVATAIEKLVAQIPETTVAVFYEAAVDQRTAFFKYLVKHAQVAKFDSLTPSQLRAWVQQEVKKLGATIERPALERLLEIVGDDQWRLEQELGKLANYDPKITRAAVEEMVVASQHQTIFELVDAIVAGKTNQAMTIFHNLLGEQVSEVYMLSMIGWQLRNLLLAKAAGRISAPELAKQAGMSPYVAQKVLSRQADYSEDSLKQAFLAVIETDFAIKTGAGEPRHLVEQLIYKLSQQERV